MQTVNFQCGHCGKLMAVDAEYLGRQVRCPHCRLVVFAPAPLPAVPVAATAPPPPGPPVPECPAHEPVRPPAAADAEDIFSPVEESDDIFGCADTPRIEMPAEPAPAPEYSSAVATTSPPPGPAAGAPDLSRDTDPFLPRTAEATSFADGSPTEELTTALAAEPPAPEWLSAPPLDTTAAPELSAPALRRAAARRGVSVWLVIPLLSYALLATGLLIVLWSRLQTAPKNPLEQYLPDTDGDRPGVEKKLKPMSSERRWRLTQVALSPSSRVRLGETLRVGALAVTPRMVEWRQVYVSQQGREQNPEPVRARGPGGELVEAPSLVLHLHLENASAEEVFQPLDRHFDRQWKQGQGPPPLTVLEAGDRRFYGGPAAWRPRGDPSGVPEYLNLKDGEGFRPNPVDAPLHPGDSCEVFVCTDAADPAAGELRRYRGGLLWRVHLRRGLVAVRGQEVPASTVVGVEFTAAQVGGG
jgi:hypothetical protein